MIDVLIDGYALSDGSGERGIGAYVRKIAGGLAKEDGLNVTMLAERQISLPEGVERRPVALRTPRRWRGLEHDFRLTRALRGSHADVLHSPAQHPPSRAPMPWVQTLHDVTPLTWQHPLLAADRRRWLRLGERMRRADAIIANSRFSADEGIRHLDLDPRRIEVIPLGVDHAVFHPGGPAEERTPYLLHVAAFGPHKGYREALAVIARLAELGAEHRLVLAGPQDDWMLGQIRRLVAASPRPDRVDVVGYVEDLAATYRGAAALLMTSRCEGFGLPALEAMACGTPVVAFANSALPEVIGDGGVLVADEDVDAMAGAVSRLLQDSDEREALTQRGLARAARFRWKDAVDGHVAVLRSAIS